MYTGIEEEFSEVVSISLMSDIWTNKLMLDIMGVAFNLINAKFQKKINCSWNDGDAWQS